MNVLPREKGSFSLNWLGPYIIIEVYGYDVNKIAYMNGVSFKEPINIMDLHCCYVPTFFSPFLSTKK